MLSNSQKYFAVLDEPSNSSMVDYYETRAKNHLSQYLNLLVSKQEDEKKVSQKIDYFDDNTAPNLIGIRKRKKFSNIGKMGVCLKNILPVCPAPKY